MKSNVIPAIILAIGLIGGGFFAGGRFTVVATQGNTVARLDRFTGAVSMCVVGIGHDSCGFVLDAPPSAKNSN